MSLDARRFIRVKRDRGTHSADDIHAFVAGGLRGEIPDYQIGAWLMAAFLNGLDAAETDALTDALVRSGRVFDWSALRRPTADKHSTGGVGDKISLVLAPLVAACGVVVPMVSGRGLGHTGGTLDKLESIPGFRTRMSAEELRGQLDRLGVAMVGQGPELAPADGMIYALRDVTSTVEFEPFLVSSIVSKKIAEGAGAIVYDVKCGNGAFVTTLAAARSLGSRLVATTRALGRASSGLITDMSQPLGRAAGNALEVCEAVEVLRGGGPPEVRELTLALAAHMIWGCGAEATLVSARARAERALERGEAWDRFLALVTAQGGDAGAVERPERIAPAPVTSAVTAGGSGWLAAVDTFGLGELVVALGGGRRSKEQVIDPRVGVVTEVRIGDRVKAGTALAVLHLAAADPGAVARARGCFRIGEQPVVSPPLVLETLAPAAGSPDARGASDG
jgi:pyrimidine-nucleoside phosphorylase